MHVEIGRIGLLRLDYRLSEDSVQASVGLAAMCRGGYNPRMVTAGRYWKIGLALLQFKGRT